MKPLNDQLQDIVITRQHTIERYKTYLQNKAQRIYQSGMKKLRSKLLSYSDNKNDSIKTRAIEKEIKEALGLIQNDIDTEFEDTLNKELSKLSEDEKDFYNDTMEKLFNNIKVNIPIVVPAEGKLYSDAKKRSLYLDNGTVTTYSELLENQRNRGKGIINGALSKSYDLNVPIVDMADEAFASEGGNYNSVIRNAMLVSYLLASHVGAVARDGFFENNEHFVDGYQWVSVMDSRTCFTADNHVKTIDGHKNINEIKIGDYIYNGKGEIVQVKETFFKKVDKLIKIELENGKIIKCTPDHLFLLKDGSWVEAQELMRNDKLAELGDMHDY